VKKLVSLRWVEVGAGQLQREPYIPVFTVAYLGGEAAVEVVEMVAIRKEEMEGQAHMVAVGGEELHR